MPDRLGLLIVGGTPEANGGVEAFCRRAATALARHGSGPVRHIPSGTAHRGLRDLWRIARTMGTVWRASADHPRIWLQYGNVADLAFLLVPRRHGVKVVVTPHLGTGWRSMQSPLVRAVSRWLLGRADTVALLSRTQAEDLRAILPPPDRRAEIATFLPEGMWRTARPQALPAGPLRLLHAGRLSADKGSLRFVKVCAQLQAAGVPFQAEVVGAGDAETEAALTAALEAAGLAGRVVRTPPLSEDALMAKLSQCDVLVHLSVQDSVPLIVLEALGCGVFPLVYPLAGPQRMIARYAGFAADPADAAGSAGAWLVDAAAHPERLGQAAAEAGARVRADFAWPAAAARVLSLW